jgi:hypothetical protein
MRHVLVVAVLAACGSHTSQATLENQPRPISPTPSSAPRVHVRCHFEDGYAVLVAQADWRDDEFLMEELIGDDPEHKKAKVCGTQGVTLTAPAGHYHLLVGETNTFERKGEYDHNGFAREIDLSGPLEFDLYEKDLTTTFPCISCPHLAAWDGTGFAPRGEVLRDVRGPALERTERTPIEARVEGKAIRLRLSEEEDEISHVDALLVEVGGKLVAPDVGDLGAVDRAYHELRTGDAVELRFPVDLPDGPVSIVVVATGYYVPLAGLR